jgi:hypothetical protein
MDAEFANYKTGLENCITRDGQTPATANISLGNFRILNLALGQLDNDAATLFQVRNATVYRNYLNNPNGAIAQRGATVTPAAAGGYGPDRWFSRRNGAVTGWTVNSSYKTAFQSGAVSQNIIKVQRTAGNASVVDIQFGQSLSPSQAKAFLTASENSGFSQARFKAIKGANASFTSVTLDLVYNLTPNANILTAAGWISFGSVTIPVANIGTVIFTDFACTGAWPFPGAYPLSFGLRVTITAPSGTAGADDSLTMTDFQLMAPLQFAGNGYARFQDPDEVVELAACQQFYWKTFPAATAPASAAGTAGAFSYLTTVAVVASSWQIPLPQRLAYTGAAAVATFNPSAAGTNWRNITDGANSGASVPVLVGDRALQIANAGAAGDVVGKVISIHATVEAEY